MHKRQLQKIKSLVKKKFREKKDTFHNLEHLERIKRNAFKIVEILGIENIDTKLLEAITYLHDITYAEHGSGIMTYLFEGQLVKQPVLQILQQAGTKEDEKEIIINAITRHAHSFPFRKLNREEDDYTKILQDADTIDLFSEERTKPFLDEKGLKNMLTNIYLNFGRNNLDNYLNYPEVADYFRENDYYYKSYINKISEGLAHKSEKWILKKYEDAFVRFSLPLVPRWIETYHLTLLTIIWSVMVLAFGFLASSNIIWLWGVSLAVALQYVTDVLDGSVGRSRNTGLVIWGFFMDHFLDYVFAFSVITSYFFIVPGTLIPYYYALGFVMGSIVFMSVVSAALTNRVSISFLGIGTTELRLIIILFNVVMGTLQNSTNFSMFQS